MRHLSCLNKRCFLSSFFIIGIALIEACSCFTTCECNGADPAPQYFDFEKLRVETKQGIGTESLRIKIIPDDAIFLAMQVPDLRHVGLTSAAYGCTPEEPGTSGLKFPLTKINITANQNFNDTLPEGSSLNAFFLMITSP